MADVLRSATIPVRVDSTQAPTPQTVVAWQDVLAFLHHLEALTEAGTSFQLVETPGQVMCKAVPVTRARRAAKTNAAHKA